MALLRIKKQYWFAVFNGVEAARGTDKQRVAILVSDLFSQISDLY